ncbi:hypothetical protein CE91St40_24970 [Oscillospiraceae bacterium]|nr:hypothetical protein CE91St40_24970 [Oscillospiraceae bacterium]
MEAQKNHGMRARGYPLAVFCRGQKTMISEKRRRKGNEANTQKAPGNPVDAGHAGVPVRHPRGGGWDREK